MKKLFYLLVALAILSAADHPMVNQMYDQTLGQFEMFARSSMKQSENAGAIGIFTDMETRFGRYSESEQAMIKKVTRSNKAVLKFRQDYCVNKDFNPVIYGAHKTEFCEVIAQHKMNLKVVQH